MFGCNLSLAGAAISIIFVASNVYLSKQNFCLRYVLSRQVYFCREKHVFVATKHIVETNINNKHVFVATKMVFVAAPANDSSLIYLNCLQPVSHSQSPANMTGNMDAIQATPPRIMLLQCMPFLPSLSSPASATRYPSSSATVDSRLLR